MTQAIILVAALATAYGLFFYHPDDLITIFVNVFVGIALLVSGTIAVTALGKGGLPHEAGAPPKAEGVNRRMLLVLLGTVVAIPVFVLLVSGFAVAPGIDGGVTLIPDSVLEPLEASDNKLLKGIAKIVEEASRPAGLVLIVAFDDRLGDRVV